MNKHAATIQFIKDGLVGLVTAGLIYALFWLPKMFPDHVLPRIIVKIVDKLFFIYLALMFFFIPILLSAFISTGINGRFIESDMSTGWAKRILKMLGVSWLVTLLVTPLTFLSFRIIDSMGRDHIDFFQAVSNVFSGFMQGDDFAFYTFISGGIIGLLLGFPAAYFATTLFKPQKRSTCMIILIIASLCMVVSGTAFGWLFTLLVYPARWGSSFGFLLLRSMF